MIAIYFSSLICDLSSKYNNIQISQQIEINAGYYCPEISSAWKH